MLRTFSPFRRRAGRLLGAAVLAGALPLGMLAAGAAPSASAATSVITISPTTIGTSLNAASEGLSFEAYDLTLPGFAAGNLATYLDTISSSSVIRVGGNTVDETFWTSTGETAPSWSMGTITPSDLTSLRQLAQASGWKVILGVNLKQYDPARAADEAKYAQQDLGSSLQAIEIGNEPDLYSQYKSNPAQYAVDFEAYVSAIRHTAPGVPIEGTDGAGAPNGSFQQAFINSQKGLASPDISELTSHYYPLAATTCGGSPTIAQLLGTTVRSNEQTEAQQSAAAAAQLGVPGVLDEGNSVVCEGQAGVSNVYASALWEIDDQLVTARAGVAGDYMHGTVEQCGSPKPLYMYYTPLCAPTATDATEGLLAAQPEFYGLAAVRDIGTGQFLTLSNPVWADVRAYAIQHADGTMTVVLDDVDDPSTTGATTVQLNLGASYGWASKVSLAASGGLTATGGITLGGQTVQSNGTLAAPVPTGFDVSGSTVTVTVPASSAQILTFSGSSSENWTLRSGGAIVGGASGDCLQGTDSASGLRAGVEIEPCNGATDQQWTVTPGGTLVGVASGLCLSVTGGSTADSATADTYTCNGSGSEGWSQQAAA